MKLPLLLLGLCTIGAGFIPFGQYVTATGILAESHIDPVFSDCPVALVAGNPAGPLDG